MQGASRESLAALRDRLAQASEGADAGALQQLSDDLFAVVTLFAAQGSLRRALSDPALASADKQRIVERLFGQRLSAASTDVVSGLAGARWSEPIDLVDAVENLAVEAALIRAEREGQLDEVEDELFRFQRILAGEPRLREALTDRSLPSERKHQLLERLLRDRVSTVTATLVDRAVLAGRGRTVERVLDQFTLLAARRRERLLARVTSATPLDDDQQERLIAALHALYGKDVRLQVIVDPSIVGGLTVRIGDELIDGSVARQLGEARRQLSSGSTSTGRFAGR